MPKIKQSKTPAPATTEVVVRNAAEAFPLVPVADLGVPSVKRNPWLRFYHPNSPQASEARAAVPQIQQGQAYCTIPEDDGVGIYPVHAIQMITAELFFSDVQQVGQEMKLLRVSREEPPRSDTKMSRDILAIILAHTPDGVFPCISSFRKAAAPALQTLGAEIRKANDWRAVIGMLTYQANTSKITGFPYIRVDCAVKPIDAKQAKAVAALLKQNPCPLMEAAVEGYTAKVAEYVQMAGG